MFTNICSPAILNIGFSMIHIIIDIFHKMYNKAIIKLIVSIVFTILLIFLCNIGLSFISWILVLLPLIFMTYISYILLNIFGMSPTSGDYIYKKIQVSNYNEPVAANIRIHKSEHKNKFPHEHHKYHPEHKDGHRKKHHHGKDKHHHEKNKHHHGKDKHHHGKDKHHRAKKHHHDKINKNDLDNEYYVEIKGKEYKKTKTV